VTLLRHARTPALLAAILAASLSGTLSAQSTAFSKSEKPFATISRMFLKAPAEDSLIRLAREQVGLRYKLGAKAPGKAFDCSGLVQWVMARFNLDVPRTSKEQAKLGLEIPKDPSQLLPGDLLFFGKGKKVSHVGIYVGDGKYVHAANRRKGVIESSLPTGRWATNWWKGVRRVFDRDTNIDSIPTTTIDSILGSHIIS
jgi:cell wall-associated NlpC family hydrolase